jgi:hypothetical protein
MRRPVDAAWRACWRPHQDRASVETCFRARLAFVLPDERARVFAVGKNIRGK